MKKTIYYISILFALLITACSNEDISVPTQTENGEEICKLTFKITIPQPSVASRAFNDGSTIDITSLCLLMFDEDGLMVGRKLAESVTDPTLQNGVYQGTYEVELAKTDENRIIHFVANYSDDIDDFPNSGNENSVLSQLNVTGTTDVYWQRMEVDGFRDTDNLKGSDEKYTIDNITETVRLIRNFVAVKMEMSKELLTDSETPNDTSDDVYKVDQNFLQGYVLFNEAKYGTVAPYFRNEDGGFANYTRISYSDLVDNQKYIGVEPVDPATGRYDATTPEEGDFTMSEKYTYERSYPTDELDSPTFIVMKGKYNGKDYYYRVDIAENFKNLHLLRNFRYILQITRTCEGYTTIPDAINGSSFNHLVDINIKVEEITDGETTLKVTPTDITVVNGTENVTVEYTCTYKGTGTGTGTQPTVSVSSPFTPEIDKTREFIKSISKPSGMSGTLTVTLNSLFKDGASLLGNGIERQRFEVRTSNGLVREVRINLIDKIDFNPKFVGPDGDGNYQYQYNLPRDLPECMFPLEIYLYEETGSFTPASGEQLSVDLIPDPNNEGRQTWRYKKVMTYADYTADVDKNFIAKFKANGTLSETATYTMHITNEYAYDGEASLMRATIIKIQDGELVWYIGDASSSQTATVTINNADVKWWYNALENFNITPALDENNFTGNKTFTISPKSMDTEVTETLTVTTADGMTDELVLKVVKVDLEVTASLNPRTNVPLGTNESVRLTINMNKKVTLTIDAQRLNNASSTTGRITTNSDGTISYTPNAIGEQTITFQTADAVRGGTVTISHEDIDDVKLNYSRSGFGNKTVNNGGRNKTGDYKIMVGTTIVGSCEYEYSEGIFGIGSYTRLTAINFDVDYRELLTETISITISNDTYTITTTIGNLISGTNLRFQ